MEITGANAAQAQVTIAGAQARLAELAVGQLYRVTVTDVYPGKAEILLGNQYLLAATPLRFQPGDVITLKLIERSPELLRFQLALPGALTNETLSQSESELATLLRAAALPDTAANRDALSMLVRAGVPVSGRSLADVVQLLAVVPQDAVGAFLPMYKELLERSLRPEAAVLKALAELSQGPPPLATALAGLTEQMREQRLRGASKRKALEDLLGAALASSVHGSDSPTAQLLKDKLHLLYGSPERALLKALEQYAGGVSENEQEERQGEVELADLANLALGEEAPAGLAALLNQLQAQRVAASLDPRRLELSLPLLLDGEPLDLQLSLMQLSSQAYLRDSVLRLRIENQMQGKVEIQLRARGPHLNVDVLVDDSAVLSYYEAELPRLTQELNELGGFAVRHAEASVQGL